MGEQRSPRGRAASSKESPPRGPREAAQRARTGLAELITHRTEGVSAVREAEEGWRVDVDVVEVPRIPDTTSLLATYEVELDADGALLRYRRIRRYRRGSADH